MGIKHNSRLAVVCRIKSTSIVKYIHSAQGRSQDFGEGGAYIEKRQNLVDRKLRLLLVTSSALPNEEKPTYMLVLSKASFAGSFSLSISIESLTGTDSG